MNESPTKVSRREQRPELINAARQIDEIAGGAMDIFNQGGSFADELAIATAVVDMRTLLTPALMAPVMALMNTDLGFRTDCDPKVKKKDGTYPTPYSVDVVREVFIESRLRGFHLCGNEFNIIAGRFYGAQAGFKRKVRELTQGMFEVSFDPPLIMGETAKIKARAQWSFKGVKGDMGIRPDDSCEIVVKVNAYMGPDGALGKAERKLCKRVYERLTGRVVPDGDAEAIDVASTATQEPGDPPTFDTVPKYEAKQESEPNVAINGTERTAPPPEKAPEKATEPPAPEPANVVKMPEQAATPAPAVAPAPEPAAPALKLAAEPEKPQEKKPAKAKAGAKTPALPGENYNYVRWLKGMCNMVGARIEDVIAYLKLTDQCDEIYQTVEEINEHQPKCLHWAYQNWLDVIVPELKGIGKIEESPAS